MNIYCVWYGDKNKGSYCENFEKGPLKDLTLNEAYKLKEAHWSGWSDVNVYEMSEVGKK